MRAWAAVFALAPLAACQTAPLPNGESEWFPLHVGDHWEYVLPGSGPPFPSQYTSEVTGKSTIAGTEWFKVFSAGTERLLRIDAQERLLQYDPGKKKETVVLDFRATPGKPFPTATFCASASTLSGDRTAGLRFQFTPRCADAGVAGQLYRSGVGLVEESTESIAGIRKWKLARARINGKEIVN